jgi:trigger factor
MQVSVEAGEGLERKMTVQVPAETVEMEVDNRLKSMQGRVKIDGFRPGKVPFKVVKQRYGTQVLQEVAGELMQSTFSDALTQENLRPAGDPSINTSGFELGSPLVYTATFEIYPELVLSPVSELKLEKLTADVTDDDVDKMLETLRKQKADWSEVDRAAEDGDRVTVSFTGTIDGEAFDGGAAQDVPITIGSGSMIPGFEEKLKGLSSGAETSISVPFPDDYHAKDLAGKKADFAINVTKVEAAELPEIDDDFAKAFGVEEGGIEKLREDIRGNMKRELDNRNKVDIKSKVMDQLLERNPVDVPKATIVEEAETLKEKTAVQQPGSDLTVESFMEDAARRVKLGMILTEVVKLSSIQVSQDVVQERIELMAKDYEDPDEFVNYYRSNPELLRSIETLVMEDMVVDWIVEQASVSEIQSSFDEIMNPGK